MGNFTRIRSPGFWVTGSVVDPQEFEDFDAIRPMLINADGGSTHAPTSPIIIGGQGIQLTGPGVFSGALTVNGALTAGAASTWTHSGTVSFGGPTVSFGGSTHTSWNSTATASIGIDSEWTVYGSMTWQNGNWPLLTSRTVTRSKWTLGWCTFASTAPASPRCWFVEGETGSGQALQTSSETTVRSFLVELLELPPGATIVNAVVRTKGSGGSSNRPVYTPVKWQGSSVKSVIGTVTNDAHDGVNWGTTAVDTTVPFTAGQSVVDPAFHYGLAIEAPWDAGSAAAMKLYDITVNLTATKVQL